MKKIIYSAMAVAMLATTSCKDDFAESFVGDQATVEFSISTPEIATRAFSEGELVDHLHYAIYEKIGEGGNVTYQITQLVATGDNVVALNNGKATINVALKTGKDYQAIFWADDEQAPYSVTFGEKGASMTVDYTNALSNDERRDAFYASVHINIEGNESKTVTLTRPFAQLNIGTSDYEAAETAGYEPTLSSVTVDAYSTMDLMTGNVTGESNAKTFGYAAIPSNEAFPVKDYEYLAMNYILVGNDKMTSEVTFRYKEGENTAEETKTVGSVPFQRNYRTNIYGKLLTGNAKIEVEIVPDYEVGTLVYDAQTLQDAIDAAAIGKTMIYLGADIEANVTVIQKPGVEITIDGSKTIQTKATAELERYKFEGTIKVHGNSNHYADAALTLKNIDFVTSTASRNFIEALENGSERYSTNITVDNCTFEATGEAVNTAVGVQIKASKWANVIDCTATNMHSLVQANSCDETVVVKGCTVNDGKNGISFTQVKAITVEETTINASEYGIRYDGRVDNYGIAVKNINVTAKQPFIARKMTANNNTIAFTGKNVLTPTTANDYQVVLTAGSDDEAYAKPTGTYTLTGADNYNVYPRDYYCPVESWNEFTAALAAGETNIKLTDDISTSASYTLTKDLKLDLNGKAFAIDNATAMLNIGDKNNSTKPNVTIKKGNLNCMVYALSGNVTIKDVVFGGTIAYVQASQGVISTKHANLLMESCKMTNVKKSGSTKPRSICTEGRSSGYLILRDCNFKNNDLDRPYINPLNGNTTLELTNCALYSMASNIDLGASYSWTNMNLTGCSGGFTFTISRASTSLTDEEMAVYKAIKQNNKGTMRFIFSDGEKNNL